MGRLVGNFIGMSIPGRIPIGSRTSLLGCAGI